jgi:hypothetical protein
MATVIRQDRKSNAMAAATATAAATGNSGMNAEYLIVKGL